MTPAAAIDLDGTLLDTNTFADYTRFAFIQSVKTLRLDIAVKVVWHVAVRKMRLTTHSTMKLGILRATGRFMTGQRLEALSHSLASKHNDRVADIIYRLRDRGFHLCLATAAPESYARLIADRFELDHCIASPSPCDNWKENSGETKLRNLQQHLLNNNLTLQAVITDHHDDLPLLKACRGERIIINPSATTIGLLSQHLNKDTDFTIIYNQQNPFSP